MTSKVVQARAPGKLFVTGEYAVLGGAPALVAAVDRYVQVRLERGGGDGAFVVESLAEERTWRATAPHEEALPDGDAGAVLAALRAVCSHAGVRPTLDARVTVDSRTFLVGERKLGLGRSAATLAAAVAVLLAALGDHGLDRTLAVGLAANALLQGGLGSGADVAAAVHGGVVEVRPSNGRPVVAHRRLPAGLTLVAGWTGTSAPTAPLLGRLAVAQAAAAPVLARLATVAEAAAAAAAREDAGALLELVDRSAGLLEELGVEVGVPIVTPTLRRLIEVARRHGAAAKPSGAGGGDCGIALVRSPAAAATLRAAWRAEGILPLELGIAAEGVRVG